VSGPGPTSLASVDGGIMPAAKATIPAFDDGLVRGDGAFEVIRVYDGVLYAMAEHMARLDRSAQNMRLPVDLELIRAEAYRLLAEAGSGPDNALLRIMVTRGGHRVMFTERLPELPEHVRLQTITYSPTRILDGVKTLSYGANMLAGRLAREAGADEALLVTPHGRVLEAPTSSVFWIEGGDVLTPPLDDHILASITRALVLEESGGREAPCPLERLLGAEAVFLASTAREVQPVVGVDGRGFPAEHERMSEVARLVAQHIASQLSAARSARS
jgi:branched-chain amino acid aminotransferase